MTPRSRKPVIISGMRSLATDDYHPTFIDFQMDDEVGQSFECENTPKRLDTTLQRSKSDSSLVDRSPFTQPTIELATQPITMKSTSDETLSTPFRFVQTYTMLKKKLQ